MTSFRDSIHTDAENYDVWCERCQKVHKHFTMTREDFDGIISNGAKEMADRIDAMALEYALAQTSTFANPILSGDTDATP